MFDLCREYQMDTSHLQVKGGKRLLCRMSFEGRSGQEVHLENIPGVMEYCLSLHEKDIEFTKTFDYIHTGSDRQGASFASGIQRGRLQGYL